MKTMTPRREVLFLAVLVMLAALLPARVEAGPKGQQTALSHVKNENARENILREGGKAVGHAHQDGGGDTTPPPTD
ncbi:MAG TPA: hypothetical protein VL688_03565 [Verrucomicrobiae bacterium]|jgi:hypothetical protein|nr:hypothetical protein [Verrucomicrobiae bacterium]